jgi:cell division protein FtsQ
VWDNARFLNALADVLYLAAAALALWCVAQAAVRAPFVPIRTVVVEGGPAHVDAEAVAAALDGRIAGNFFGVKLADVQRELAKLPWVHRVDARREWPDRIVVRLEEHRALARWADRSAGSRLVSTDGVLFEAETDAPLPELAGPPGTERELARRYLAFRELLAPLGTVPTHLTLSARHAWQVRLANGMVLELGRDQARQSLEERLARFVAAYPRAAAQLAHRVGQVDLRYPNGFAIRLQDVPPPEGAASRKRT